jgi:type IV secretion system protein VirD4
MRFTRLILIASILLAAYSTALLVYLFPWAWLALAIGVLYGLAKRGIRYTAYGTARWANSSDLPRNDGFLLGHLGGSRPSILFGIVVLLHPRVSSAVACDTFLSTMRKKAKQLIRIPVVHTAVFSPTGGGKGVSFVIPHLLTCPESTVVVDFKGENAKATMRARRAMGHKVVLLDPFKVVTQEPDTFNPLDFIDKDSSVAIDECRDLAEALVIRTGQEREPHWADSAEVWIAAMLATVANYGDGSDRSLQAVRMLLTDTEKMQAAIKLMCESDDWGGMLSRLGHQLTHFKEKELGSTLTTTNRFMRFLDTSAIAESTKASSFAPADLLKGKMTVYLILPPEHMRAQAALLRTWIGSMLRAVVRGGLSERRVHFVLDEAATLGHMDALDDAVDKLRGYGVRLQFYYQSLGQLKKCWPEGQDQTLLSNTTQVFFGVNDQQTAEYVSNRLGEETIVINSGGSSSGRSSQSSPQSSNQSYSWNESGNWQQHGRKLLKPEEVVSLPERTAITFTPGTPPICTTLVRYYEPDFGRKPGRFWPAVRAFGNAVLLLAAVGLAALALTQMAGEESAPERPAASDFWLLR